VSLASGAGLGAPASEPVGEPEGRSPSEQKDANERERVSLASGAGHGAPASEPVGESEGRGPSEQKDEAGAGYTQTVAGIAEITPDRQTHGARFRITCEPLDVAATVAAVETARCGAVTMFVGLVRDHNAGRTVVRLEYECFEPLAIKSFERIASEAEENWPGVRLAIAHRIGSLRIGDASVAIAAASPHRAEAFAASRYAIERIKQIAPIWKHEHFEGGDVWVEGATADPDNEDARRQAVARAQP